MTTSKLNFSFKVSGISGSFNIDTQQNVKKHIADILYLESPPDDSVNLYYVGAKELNALRNIFIADRSTSLYENNKSNETEYIGYYNSVVNLKNTNFIVTQEFIEVDSGFIPLYYKYSLPLTIYPDSVKVFDKDFNEVSLFKIVLVEETDEDTGIPTGTYLSYDVYNSYESSFDYNTAEYEAYFIQYSYDDSGIQKTKTELLNNELAYKQATWEDYWSLTFSLKPWARVYNINDNLLLQLPNYGSFAIKYLESRRLSVKYPVSVSNTEPWFFRISNSSFRSGYHTYNYSYSVAEFSNQSFNPIEPYKLGIRNKAYKITDRLIALSSGNIQDGFTYSDIQIIFEKDGNVEHALTNDSSLDGTAYTDIKGQRSINSITGKVVYWDYSNFLSYDRLSGIVYVGVDVDDSYDIYATFPYKEEFYTLTSLNMNPIFNPSASESIYSIYIVPESENNDNLGVQDSSVMWLKISKSGVILDTNQDGSGGNENLKQDTVLSDVFGYSIDGVLGLHYGWRANATVTANSPISIGIEVPVESTSTFPESGWLRTQDHTLGQDYKYFKYISKTDTSFILDNTGTTVVSSFVQIGDTLELVNFIDERTTNSNRDIQHELDHYGWYGLPSVVSRYFILAETSVNQPHGIHNLSVIDVRQNGGGIKKDLYEEAKNINPEVQWFSDFNDFNGQVLPGNSALVIKLPISLLDDFSIAELKEMTMERMPVGVYPIVKFYGYQPRILSVESVASGITIEWEKEGSEFTYDVWYSQGEDGPWTKKNITPIEDSDSVGLTNTYSISGLSSGANYSVKITMTDNYSYA